MINRKLLWSGAAAALLAVAGVPAHAATYDVNLAGWLAGDDFGYDPNSFLIVNLPAGATVTGFDYLGLQFSTVPSDDSWLSDLVLSVNHVDGDGNIEDWLDWKPSTTGAGGTFGPASGSWNGPTGSDGPYSSTGSFEVLAGGFLYVTVYLDEYYPSDGITISAGTLRINYDVAVVPEPATYGMMALGLLAVGAMVRRRA